MTCLMSPFPPLDVQTIPSCLGTSPAIHYFCYCRRGDTHTILYTNGTFVSIWCFGCVCCNSCPFDYLSLAMRNLGMCWTHPQTWELDLGEVQVGNDGTQESRPFIVPSVVKLEPFCLLASSWRAMININDLNKIYVWYIYIHFIWPAYKNMCSTKITIFQIKSD